jgi:hypothetical protein
MTYEQKAERARDAAHLQQDLKDALRECSFLLNSARLVIADQHARDKAGAAVANANQLLRRMK